jgi:hypothetical protein
MTSQDRYRAADRVARDALDVDVLADEVRDAVRSDDLMLMLATAASDLETAGVCDGARAIESEVDDVKQDARDLARWRARNLAESVRSGWANA